MIDFVSIRMDPKPSLMQDLPHSLCCREVFQHEEKEGGWEAAPGSVSELLKPEKSESPGPLLQHRSWAPPPPPPPSPRDGDRVGQGRAPDWAFSTSSQVRLVLGAAAGGRRLRWREQGQTRESEKDNVTVILKIRTPPAALVSRLQTFVVQMHCLMSSHFMPGTGKSCLCRKRAWGTLKKLNISLPYDPAILFPDVYPELKTDNQTNG